jgi:uncharacterized membrane protein
MSAALVPHVGPHQDTSGIRTLVSPIRNVLALPVVTDRLVFVDLARVLAILMMIQGHVLDALLSSDYRTAAAFHVWSFLRGLTSCLFLVLSGFVLAMTTQRRWAQHASGLATHARCMRRCVALLALGYLLHRN